MKIHVHKNEYCRKESIAPHCATSRQQQPFGKSISNVFWNVGMYKEVFFNFQSVRNLEQNTFFG